MADRFTYLPQIGIAIALTCGPTTSRSWRFRRVAWGVASAAGLIVLLGWPGARRLFGATA